MQNLIYKWNDDAGEGEFAGTARERLDIMFAADPVSTIDFLTDLQHDAARLYAEYWAEYEKHFRKRRRKAGWLPQEWPGNRSEED